MLKWDIFCKVVDNFGDIGICWRLAKQLSTEHSLPIRLWVDDLNSAKKIIKSLKVELNQQVVDEISIIKWHTDADFSQAANVVIEAFACELPAAYLAAMTQQKSKWLNLEYLSAESWVDDFHGKPSPKPELKLVRYFYFPGFTEKTGGLIRERDITAQIHSHINPRPQAGEGARQHRRGAIPGLLDTPHLSNLSPASGRETFIDDTLKISLFCYPFAPISDLLTALKANALGHPLSNPLREFDSPCDHAVHVYVPQSSILPNIAQFFGKNHVQVGDKLCINNLTVEILPFLSQADYDQLLRDCDLNFVRGEDSWIRAIWAGKPFIWQPYIQDENAHMKKLDAFLDYFYANCNEKKSVCEAHRCWSAGHMPMTILNDYLSHLKVTHCHTQMQSAKQMAQADLASKLVDFCNTI